MKAIVGLLSFMVLLAPVVQGAVNVYLYHVSSEKYIGEFQGPDNTTVYLVPTLGEAQLFTIVLNEMGFIQLKTSTWKRYIDKRRGCSLTNSNEMIYYERLGSGNNVNQLFTFNNDNTIGSRCCEACFLSSNENNTSVVMKKLPKDTDSKEFLFKIVPGQKANDGEIC